MAETLYRKYRPATFADVTEQEHVVRTLQNQLARGSVAHAYLFAGPRGVGKTTIARLLAKAVNCVGKGDGAAEPCNACEHCVAFQEGRFMDTVEIDAASHTGVDNVRENIIENVRFFPQQGKYKVFIIDEVHMLSASAFNALLKTLEEPPAHALFILATTELHKIPATIISRCQRFDFHRIPAPEMIARLASIAEREGKKLDETVLARIAKLSEGCLRDAESLLGQVLIVDDPNCVLPETNIVLVRSMLDAVAKGDVQAALTSLDGFVQQGGGVKHLIEEAIEEVRDVMFVALESKPSLFTVADARRLLDLLLSARNRPSLSLLPHLPFELALVEFSLRVPPAALPIGGVPIPRPNGNLVAPRPPAPSNPPIPLNPSNPPNATSFTLDDIQNKWERCCEYVADRNAALPLVLRASKPTAVADGTVTVTVAYAFHADALNELKSKRLIEEAVATVMLQPAVVKFAVEPQKSDDALSALTQAFGGSVVG